MTALFTAGALGTRSAGCIVNDMIDKDIDDKVERTKVRPLAAQELTQKQAALFFGALAVLDFGILFSLPWGCIKLGFVVTPLIFLYPTTKRYFKLPQLVLGTIFNSGVMFGFAATSAAQAINWSVCLPFWIGGIAWTMVYDTIYAF